jgi:YVTN family beta-propeller protein
VQTSYKVGRGLVIAAVGMVVACGSEDETDHSLRNRAYVVSEESDGLFIVDLDTMAPVGMVDTGLGGLVNANHMAALSADARKVYVAATRHNALVVVDAVSLKVTGQVPVGARPTHLGLHRDSGALWVVNEDDNSISVVDTQRDIEVQTIRHSSLMVPHFVRFAGDRAFVPNIAGNQISVIDTASHLVTEVLSLDATGEPSLCAGDPCGFADAQIDNSGVLLAAHIESGQVLAYDTATHTRLANIHGGARPWAVFVDPFDKGLSTSLMPNWADATVSVLDRRAMAEVARSAAGDVESYGVNYTPKEPAKAFVLNRVQQRVAIVDRSTGELIDQVAVGSTTETASTTAGGDLLLLPLSSANAFAVLDMGSRDVIARFDGVGEFPWSVATAGGQNYCH